MNTTQIKGTSYDNEMGWVMGNNTFVVSCVMGVCNDKGVIHSCTPTHLVRLLAMLSGGWLTGWLTG